MAKDLWPVHRERMDFESAVTLRSTVAAEKARFKPMDARWAAFKTSRKMQESYKRDYFQPATVVARHMNDFEYSVFMESAVYRLIDLCRAGNTTIVIIIHRPHRSSSDFSGTIIQKDMIA